MRLPVWPWLTLAAPHAQSALLLPGAAVDVDSQLKLAAVVMSAVSGAGWQSLDGLDGSTAHACGSLTSFLIGQCWLRGRSRSRSPPPPPPPLGTWMQERRVSMLRMILRQPFVSPWYRFDDSRLLSLPYRPQPFTNLWMLAVHLAAQALSLS